MELTLGSGFTLAALSCFYISLISCPMVSAKCYGRWAIHACYGGNGKRSDPNLSPSTDKLPPTLLRQLLVSDVRSLSQLLQGSEEAEVPIREHELRTRPGFDSESLNDPLVPAVAAQEEYTPLRRLQKYMRDLKLRRALRGNDDETLI